MPKSTVFDFEKVWAKRRAEEFVEIYCRDGPGAASKYARDNIPIDKAKVVHPYTEEEFDKRGAIRK
jgi:hypothetical protein